MAYKYVCVGLLNPDKAGKITAYFHDNCALHFNGIGAGHNAVKMNENERVPLNTKCSWCGKLMRDSEKKEA